MKLRLKPRDGHPSHDIGAGYDDHGGTFFGYVFDRQGGRAETVVNLGDVARPIGNPQQVVDALLPYIADDPSGEQLTAALTALAELAGDQFTESGALSCQHCGATVGETQHDATCPRAPVPFAL